MNGQVKHINPEGLFKSPAFSQAITVQGTGKTIYIGGQDAVNVQHELVGKNDIAKQTEQIMMNLQTILQACGADFEHLVKMNIYLLNGQDLTKGFEVSQRFLGDLKSPPVVTVVKVAALGSPDYLLEIDAVAFLPE